VLAISDTDWWAIDNYGHLGQFANCAKGAIPLFYIQNQDYLDVWYDRLTELFPPKTEALLTPIAFQRQLKQQNTDHSNYKEWSARGFYSFDLSDDLENEYTVSENGISGTYVYHLICTPDQPIHIRQLPIELATLMPRINDPTVDFRKLNKVQLQPEFASIEF